MDELSKLSSEELISIINNKIQNWPEWKKNMLILEKEFKKKPLIKTNWTNVIPKDERKKTYDLIQDIITYATYNGYDESTIKQALHSFIEEIVYEYDIETCL